MQQIRDYIEFALPNEVTGIGSIEVIPGAVYQGIDGQTIHGEDHLRVTEIYLPPQFTSAGHCEFKDGALNDIILHVMEDSPTGAANLRFRWHSHADGKVFWSSVDEQDISNWKGAWVVNLVMNARGEYLMRLDMFRDLRFTMHDLQLEIMRPEDLAARERHRREIQSCLEVKRPVFYQPKRPFTPEATTSAAQKEGTNALRFQ